MTNYETTKCCNQKVGCFYFFQPAIIKFAVIVSNLPLINLASTSNNS